MQDIHSIIESLNLSGQPLRSMFKFVEWLRTDTGLQWMYKSQDTHPGGKGGLMLRDAVVNEYFHILSGDAYELLHPDTTIFEKFPFEKDDGNIWCIDDAILIDTKSKKVECLGYVSNLEQVANAVLTDSNKLIFK